MLTVSGKTGKGIDQLLAAAFEIREIWSKRVTTGQLNRWFEDAVEKNPPPAPGGKRIKLRYITQVNTRPPSFVLFGTRVDQLPDSYLRYLVNGIRRELGFGAVPVRLQARASRNPVRRGRQELRLVRLWHNGCVYRVLRRRQHPVYRLRRRMTGRKGDRS